MANNFGATAGARTAEQQPDFVENTIRTIDQPVRETAGVSLFHVLTLGSIGASIGLYLAGKKELAIFVGLWPPTFLALKAASENQQTTGRRR